MAKKMTPLNCFLNKSTDMRANELFLDYKETIFKQTDQLFAGLMVFQWLVGIIVAIFVSPRTWTGTESQIHIHVWTAIFLGGFIAFYPVFLALTQRGKTFTRHIIAISQMLMSALLIHLTGGRIETHFHVFGSLAFLSFYRDWKVLIPATIVVAADHLIRGIFWPESVYGVLRASPWRFLEHAAWVLFEDIFLVFACIKNVQEMRKMAYRTAELELINQVVEQKVEERTLELTETNKKLEHEISERKKLHEAMLQSEKMAAVGRLAGGVAHEINNPLGVILGFSQGVMRQMTPGNDLEVPLRSIEREAVRCKRLVQDLLTFSRSTKGDKEELDINEAVDEALSLISAQGRVRQIDLVKDLDLHLDHILGNKNQIQQIIINLSSNSLDAMPKGGKLIIRTRKSNDHHYVELVVEDTGQGIPEEFKKKIFDPFFTTKEIGKGTGLGLSLVYEIVEKHNGKVFLESEVQKGTVFHVLFPIANGNSNGKNGSSVFADADRIREESEKK